MKFRPPVSFVLLAALLPVISEAAHAAPVCVAPAPVCAAAKRVFAISSTGALASAVLVNQGLLVTSRYVVSDNPKAIVRLPLGGTLAARTVPSSFIRDLIFIRVDGLNDAPPLPIRPAEAGRDLYVIGTDATDGDVRVSRSGVLRAAPLRDKPKSRVHHSAPTVDGNSGGALVDAEGRLIGIIARGADGLSEAIPAVQLTQLAALSGAKHGTEGRDLSVVYRRCIDGLKRGAVQQFSLTPRQADELITDCRQTGNRYLLDQLGVLLREQ